jgi:hypothetical protein
MLIIISKGGSYMAAFVNPNKIQKTHYDIQPDPGLDLGHASSTRRRRQSARRHCQAHAATVDPHATTESTQLLQPSSQWSAKSAQPPLYHCCHPHHVLCEYARVTEVDRERVQEGRRGRGSRILPTISTSVEVTIDEMWSAVH